VDRAPVFANPRRLEVLDALAAPELSENVRLFVLPVGGKSIVIGLPITSAAV
jgi:hypothetical protein